jgi:hypothetical protein
MKEEGFTKSFKLIEGLGQAKAKREASREEKDLEIIPPIVVPPPWSWKISCSFFAG